MGALAAIAGLTAGAFSFLLPEWHKVRRDPNLREDVRLGEAAALTWSLILTAAIATKAGTGPASYQYWGATSLGLIGIYEWALHDGKGRESDPEPDCGCQ